MQLVFQDFFGSLNPTHSVWDTVVEPLVLEQKLGRQECRARVDEALAATHLERRHLGLHPDQLTASEQQRVGIARAIVTRPKLIVLDEPTSNLDPSTRAEILELLVSIQKEFGTSYLFISHDLTAVDAISHRIAVMYLGHIVEVAAAAEITTRQYHPYSRALLSAVLYPDPRHRLDAFSLSGEIPTAINPPDECPLVGRCPLALPSCQNGMPALTEVTTGHWSACYRSSELVAGGDGSAHQADHMAATPSGS